MRLLPAPLLCLGAVLSLLAVTAWAQPLAAPAAPAAAAPAIAAPSTGAGAVIDDLDDDGLLPPLAWRDTQVRRVSGMIGVAAGIAPEYSGSTRYHALAEPYGVLRYDNFFTLRHAALGATDLYLNALPLTATVLRQWQSGPFLRWRRVRYESDSSTLSGLGDTPEGLDAGWYASYYASPIYGEIVAYHDFSGNGMGNALELRWGREVRFSENWLGAIELGMVLADAHRISADYGISAEQSAASGLRAYTPGQDVEKIGIAASASYALDAHWRLSARLGYERIWGTAHGSPLVFENGTPLQANLLIGLGWAF